MKTYKDKTILQDKQIYHLIIKVEIEILHKTVNT